MQLLGSFHIDFKDIRGIGLQVTKLESDDNTKQGQPCLESVGPSTGNSKPSSHETHSNQVATLPSFEDLDLDVIKSLPPELFLEINGVYGGKLKDLISNSEGEISCQHGCTMSAKEVKVNHLSGCIRLILSLLTYLYVNGHLGNFLKEEEEHASGGVQIENIEEKDKAGCSNNQGKQSYPAFGAATANIFNSMVEPETVDLMPTSLSQVDMSILQQLPEELRADVIGALPAHRSSNCLPESSGHSGEAQGVRAAEDSTGMECNKDNNLWVGNPPFWVQQFKISDCLLLHILAEMFLRSGSTGLLSSILQCCLSEF